MSDGKIYAYRKVIHRPANKSEMHLVKRPNEMLAQSFAATIYVKYFGGEPVEVVMPDRSKVSPQNEQFRNMDYFTKFLSLTKVVTEEGAVYAPQAITESEYKGVA